MCTLYDRVYVCLCKPVCIFVCMCVHASVNIHLIICLYFVAKMSWYYRLTGDGRSSRLMQTRSMTRSFAGSSYVWKSETRSSLASGQCVTVNQFEDCCKSHMKWICYVMLCIIPHIPVSPCPHYWPSVPVEFSPHAFIVINRKLVGGDVVAGFPNPLPDTLHLLFSWFVCVRVRVWSCVRVLARLHVPVLVALLVALASRSTPVQWLRAHTDCACAKYFVLLRFSRLTCVSHKKVTGILQKAHVFSAVFS